MDSPDSTRKGSPEADCNTRNSDLSGLPEKPAPESKLWGAPPAQLTKQDILNAAFCNLPSKSAMSPRGLKTCESVTATTAGMTHTSGNANAGKELWSMPPSKQLLLGP